MQTFSLALSLMVIMKETLKVDINLVQHRPKIHVQFVWNIIHESSKNMLIVKISETVPVLQPNLYTQPVSVTSWSVYFSSRQWTALEENSPVMIIETTYIYTHM